LPTKLGPVAPARWRRFRDEDDREFAGTTCDFMDTLYFRQEVLIKYEVTSGFEVNDNGSVSNIGYWGLTRSTSRIGNELLTSAIGDFAEGVPFEEWLHWQQYAVEPPSEDSLRAVHQEKRQRGELVTNLGVERQQFVGRRSGGHPGQADR
jgi:hypothetical protein